jgi:hypothetical protein
VLFRIAGSTNALSLFRDLSLRQTGASGPAHRCPMLNALPRRDDAQRRQRLSRHIGATTLLKNAPLYNEGFYQPQLAIRSPETVFVAICFRLQPVSGGTLDSFLLVNRKDMACLAVTSRSLPSSLRAMIRFVSICRTSSDSCRPTPRTPIRKLRRWPG